MLKSKNKLLHKALAFVLTFSLLASLVSFNFTASALAGEGTEQTPYKIATLDDLKEFATNINNGTYTNVYAKLTTDITITDSWTPIGNTDHKFTGVFDGDNKTINFNGTTNGEYVGLFGINEGTIKNVKVAGTITSDTELAFVGGVAGLNRGTITNCESSVAITANGVNSYAGGIAGVMQNGTIESCKNSGAITVHVTNKVTNDVTKQEASAGGIVAFNYNGTVKKCENKADIRNDEVHGYTGGIVGNNDGTINNCLNGGTVSNTDNNGAQYAGGIAGNLFTNNATGSTATISNCLNTNESGKVVGTNGTEPNNGKVTNSYYLSTNVEEDNNGAISVTDDQLKSGEVTYKLNGNTAANPVWGQDLTTVETTLPTIGATENSIVYPEDSNGYTNIKPNDCNHTYENGACTICGDILAKVSGYNISLAKAIGLNFYFDVKDSINIDDLKVSFNDEEGTLNQETKLTTGLADGYNRYVSTFNLDSDQMNNEVTATLTFNHDTESITVTSSPYTVNKYLNTLYTSPTGDIAKTKKLVQAMETYGFYANEYFGKYSTYETAVTMLDLTTVDTSKLDDPKYNYTLAGDTGTFTHYASSLQYLEDISGVFYVKGYSDSDTVWMQYKELGIDEDMSTNSANATTKTVTKTNKGYSYGITDQVSIVELGTIKFAVTFGTMDNEQYTAKSNIKYYSPYTYIRNLIRQYNDDKENDAYKLAVALFSYSEAAADYFPSQNS